MSVTGDPPPGREHPEPTVLVRPDARTPAATARAWLDWFGWGRVVAAAVSIVLVVGGGWLLLRAPTPPVEQSLPMATTTVADHGTTGPTDPAAATARVEPSTSAPFVVVHVAGAVRAPGVYSLRGGARLHAAVDAAGGPTATADLDRLNLAQAVVDGQQVFVPEHGQDVPVPAPSGPVGGPASGTGPPTLIDLNRADAAALESLPGVGPSTAAAIIDDRLEHGPFATVDELVRVPGIGPAKLAALRDLVTV